MPSEIRRSTPAFPKERVRTAAEIFKSGIGMSDEMNVVFAAMALHAGLDARPALVADRNEITFNPKVLVDTYFLDNIDMAVKLAGSWKIFDVSSKLLAPGMLSWREEGGFALVSDPKAPVFIQTPVSPPDASVRSRVAHLELSVDGSIEGDVQESYTGHHAEDGRSEIFVKSNAEREEWIKDRVTRMFPDAEVTEIKLENVEDTTHPLQIRYHLEAPAFRTGHREALAHSADRGSSAETGRPSPLRNVVIRCVFPVCLEGNRSGEHQAPARVCTGQPPDSARPQFRDGRSGTTFQNHL